ncbi:MULTISPECIES: amidase [unclassified Paenibacillus]|uniref:amidase n=1 Tax=unclassified Paenibacillus TaxID=185978 RepID=UPI002406E463|nr:MULTISPECIES: amidase [unclassified Paenibacillus]MDF9839776.1 aspartyl-tRNA(Asn)/glutamyl-tRNA(Gln) amidotransferase subunit A [Paenibacillus sp. PastF-2]MDF9846356.1 aspartyl-tRNA(Asn)/glutamyl-tRNA(Gln) amidotransferase subunit A [Paenibacillus sp. PastM-2]MDF9853294.1 aspartyl-tRNA(Asn)/glutamyl-tRNA(Gln) amidotransferase subunit A [Paenibacillus sp. PastF-1]MDH6478202.1 aspartyl-tRNA(Asn)/glutamyl-tRNA(Gln) amidotransferase subunit A [Paenibacillus sp. PastH-2]MDH6506299.1 aspartyl-tRN
MHQNLAANLIEELAPLIADKQISPVEVTASVLELAEKYNPVINAYIRIDADGAMAAASRAEAEIAAGNYKGALHGIPMALKDIFHLKGAVATMGSKIHGNFISDYDAAVVAKLKEAGVVMTGTLNMTEYAWGGRTNNAHYGQGRNPWDPSRIPGGSSGGSGAAVAADISVASIGTDTAGSIRIPSSACGIVGLKPTHGRVSKYGCFPLSWSLDHVGPMTKSVTDAAFILQAIAGYDPNDPTTLNVPVPVYTDYLSESLKGMVIGIDEDYYFKDVDPGVESAVLNAISVLEKLGAVIKKVSVPYIHQAMYAEYTTAMGESSAIHHNHLKSRPMDFGYTVRRNLAMGELLSASDYLMGQQLRRKITEGFSEVFKSVDILVSPTLPIVAPLVEEEVSHINGAHVEDELIRLTCPSNLAGLPSLTVPCGFSKGLPVGLQFIGSPFSEGKLLNAGYAFERTNLLRFQKPNLHTYVLAE